MAKMKIYELAKSLNKSNKDIIQFLNDKGIEVKSHMNSIEDNQIDLVKKQFGVKTPNESPSKVFVTDVKEKPIMPTVREEAARTNNTKLNQNGQNRNQTMNNQNRTNSGTVNRTQSSGSQGNRPQGNRPQGSNQQGNRPQGSKQQGNRPQGSKQQGNRPHGNGQQGNRPQGSNQQGNRPQGNRPQGNRPQGDANGRYVNGGTGAGGRDNRPQRNDGRPGQASGQNYSNNRNANQNRGPQGQDNRDNRNNRNNDNRNNNNRNNNNRFNGNNRNNRNHNQQQNNVPAKDPNRKGAFIKPEVVKVVEEEIKQIVIPETITLKELADKMKQPVGAIVKKLFMQGKMVSINSEISFEEAEEIAMEYDIIVELEEQVDVIEELLKEEEEEEGNLVKRPPVVCVMGHVDHGKTSLLDAIRSSHVTSGEAGGITQHIGASVVKYNGENITFLDTPGHEAFTSMRMRGAQSTDIAILVVAADDGVMPQTVEAINHAKAAGIEIIVAINKIDKPSANIERVKQELVEYELIAEDWGGSTIFVPVSAHTKEGIDQLLEMILLTSEILELKANPNRNARGIVIEAKLDKGKGSVATVLVQKGTLHVGDPIVIGSSYGKIRAMIDDKGRRVKEAGPSTPVEILGLNDVPEAGEVFLGTDNEKEARSIAEVYIKKSREKLLDDTKAKLSLDGLFSQIQAGNIKELNLIIKADVQGSVEAMKQSLLKLSNEEVAVRVIHGGVGAINESDIMLASASNAIVIGFNVRPDHAAKDIAEREQVDLRLYRVIYNAIDDIEAALKGMLEPIYEEKVIAHSEIRATFKASGLGTIAGCYVLDGKVLRNTKVRITREGKLIFEGNLQSLKIVKDDVKEVAKGYECGMVFEKFNDVKEFDQIEHYMMVEVPR